MGKTQNRVMDRFIGHRADLRGEDKSKPAYHFKKEDHEEDDMGVAKTTCTKSRGKDTGSTALAPTMRKINGSRTT